MANKREMMKLTHGISLVRSKVLVFDGLGTGWGGDFIITRISTLSMTQNEHRSARNVKSKGRPLVSLECCVVVVVGINFNLGNEKKNDVVVVFCGSDYKK
jgi:hypothetical protein